MLPATVALTCLPVISPSAPGGMGCSAGILAVDLAQKLLKVRCWLRGTLKPPRGHLARLPTYLPSAGACPLPVIFVCPTHLPDPCLPGPPVQERGCGGYALVVSTENITQNWCGPPPLNLWQ